MSETIINGIIEESQEISGRMQYARGAKGDDGIGISDISKTSTVGKVDTYTITLTDGTTKTFTVTNGDDGANGISVSTASINSSGHLILTLSNGTSIDAGVASEVYIGTTPPTDPSIKVWIDTSGEAGDVEMTSNKVTSISSESTDIQYPSAKAVANIIGDIDATFANALKGTASGSVLALNDVSPVEHTMGVKVRGKNLFDKSIPFNTWEVIGGGYSKLSITVPIGSQITASVLKAYAIDEKKGKLYVTISEKHCWLFNESNSSLCKKSGTATATDGTVFVKCTAEGYNSLKDELMIEINSEATDYMPYISDYTAVSGPYITYLFNRRCVFTEEDLNQYYWAPIYIDKTFEPVAGKTYYIEISNSAERPEGMPDAYNAAGTCTATANSVGGYTLQLDGYIRIETCSEGHGETWTNSFKITYMQAPSTAAFDLKIGEEVGDITRAVKLIKTNADGTVSEEYTPTADGTVNGVTSFYPCTKLSTDMKDIKIYCEYNRDINKAFEELQQAIISLGGNV